jgi:hypothetical protein
MKNQASTRVVLIKRGYVTQRGWCMRLKCDTCKFKFKCYTTSKTVTVQTSNTKLYEGLTGDINISVKDFVAGEWIRVKFDDNVGILKPIDGWYLVVEGGTSYGCVRCVNLEDTYIYKIPWKLVKERFEKVEKPTI